MAFCQENQSTQTPHSKIECSPKKVTHYRLYTPFHLKYPKTFQWFYTINIVFSPSTLFRKKVNQELILVISKSSSFFNLGCGGGSVRKVVISTNTLLCNYHGGVRQQTVGPHGWQSGNKINDISPPALAGCPTNNY